MTLSPLKLTTYYAAVDNSDFEDALAHVSPAIRFSIVVPTGTVRGEGHDGIRGYLDSRGDVDRRHVPLSGSRDGDLEFIYGAVVEDGTRTTGHFLASAHLGADGLIDAYQVAFDPELTLLEEKPAAAPGSTTPTLERWFEIMDSGDPDRVLGMITDDFCMSVQFSKGQGQSAEFVGDQAGLIHYLEQREKSALVHHIDLGSTVGDTELVLGRTTRDGVFEASFNASAQLRGGRVRRLLICRTPEMSFD